MELFTVDLNHSFSLNTFKRPGMAFSSYESLKKKESKLKKLGLNCKLTHRNYNWKENSTDLLPGWNFLEFKNLGFNTIEPWLITYDPHLISKKLSGL